MRTRQNKKEKNNNKLEQQRRSAVGATREKNVHAPHHADIETPARELARDAHDPAARARILAMELLHVAKLLETQHARLLEEKISNEMATIIMTKVAQPVYKAWLAFHGLDEKRHERLALIEAIKTGSAILLKLDETHPRTSTDDGRVSVVADLAQTFYALNFPERAAAVNASLLASAITAWPNEAGRPKPGAIGKWMAISRLARNAGFPSTSPRTIQREWLRHAHELELGNPWTEKPPIPNR